MTLPAEHPLSVGLTTGSALVRTLRGESAAARAERTGGPVSTPVWFMRQAGRSLPEYRATRAGIAMLDACLDPAVASEITLQPVRRHGVDAAIFFSDIVVPLLLAGVDVDIVAGTGPVLPHPVRTADDVARLPVLDPAALAPVSEGVARTVAQLGGTPLIGFAGAPFTLVSYLVEGGPSKDQMRARTLMHSAPGVWHDLMTWAADVTGAFLRAQVLAGASAAQLFDSWAGSLSLQDYVAHVQQYSRRALSHVADLAVPVIHFGTGTGELLVAMRDAGADVVGVDHRIGLDEASRRLGGTTVLQGNIDPALLAAPWPVLEAHVRDVLRRGTAVPAHVLNLGHGVPPSTDPDVLTRIAALAHGAAE
ncbi:MAG: uroporphyrinogen decarboxylase [Cellulomonadaceae bacterium]|nr:uroporphyrinogen decarboxylase [Cellulomonadaceae bacterium]